MTKESLFNTSTHLMVSKTTVICFFFVENISVINFFACKYFCMIYVKDCSIRVYSSILCKKICVRNFVEVIAYESQKKQITVQWFTIEITECINDV